MIDSKIDIKNIIDNKNIIDILKTPRYKWYTNLKN